ncbi:MAG: LysE family translocator [Gammaproteobacteria bacterium]|nr:LysE family translocator [Gammaproteobacteria bacterium]
MDLALWWLYAGTVLIFMLTPGPSHLLMLSNSLNVGWRRSLATAVGDLSANMLQMTAAALGLAGLIREFQNSFLFIKWLGVAYLVYLGLRLWLFHEPARAPESSRQPSSNSLFLQGFITSAVNPKAVVFFAALFPLFIQPAQPLLPQFIVLSLTYIFIDGVFLCGYGWFAERFGRRSAQLAGGQLRRVSGALLIAAAILLGLKDLPDN